MKIVGKIKIISRGSISELPEAWTKQDFLNILDLLGFSEQVTDAELVGYWTKLN